MVDCNVLELGSFAGDRGSVKMKQDTIAAISTAQGEGAIAIVRISGCDARGVVSAVFRGGDLYSQPRRMVCGEVYRKGNRLDRVMAVGFCAPNSYTGEDMAEIHGHGGIYLANELLGSVLEAGARLAEPGEFTQRAFLNGKMDLTQAEAVMDVIRARTEASLRAAGEQLVGALGKELGRLRGEVLSLVANVEGWIDFPEEGIEPETGASFEEGIRQVLSDVRRLLGTAAQGRILREGVRLVLCGAPNAGKSSLLNRLLGFERAIVAPTPGTTRDTIEESASLRGILFRITDTAGLRESDDPVEQIGVRRAREAMESADILLRVLDATELKNWEGGLSAEREVIVVNKCDLEMPSVLPPGVLAISCRTGQGMEELVDHLVARAGLAGGLPRYGAINVRQQACLTRVEVGLVEALEDLCRGQAPEYVAIGLRAALDALGEVLGEVDVEEILGEIFSKFCIGK